MDREKQIINELVNKCGCKAVADEVMLRLERRWGKPKVSTVDRRQLSHIIESFNSDTRCVGNC